MDAAACLVLNSALGRPRDKDMAKHPKSSSSVLPDLTRRSFLETVSAGVVGAAITSNRETRVHEASHAHGGEIPINLSINGVNHKVLVEPRMSLLFVLRERLGLTGTKVGCERGECGACTVIIDGKARYSCLAFAAQVEDHEITTVEGLATDDGLSPIQR
jgi:xanthine dehydrogenase YagT iron-sulfur-binding subunit